MEVIYTGLRRTPEQIVRAAIEEDVNVIGVSILSASHIAHLSKIQRLLEEQGALDIALVAGGVIPREDIPLLQEIGVKRVFVAGTPIGEIAEYVASILRAPAATQADVSVATLADVVVHVGMPGMGDQVQVSEAGMLEIADVYVVNKSDHPEAAKAIVHLRANIDLFYPGLPGAQCLRGRKFSARQSTGAQAARLVDGRRRLLAAAGAVDVRCAGQWCRGACGSGRRFSGVVERDRADARSS
jgi:methylmalonyl-CoA mutase cobalamin-binding domain/chain